MNRIQKNTNLVLGCSFGSFGWKRLCAVSKRTVQMSSGLCRVAYGKHDDAAGLRKNLFPKLKIAGVTTDAY